jgi:phage-related protein
VALENVEEAIGGGLLPMLTRLINTGSEVLQWTTDHGQATKILLGVLAAGAGAFLVYAAATKAVTATTIIANGVQAIFRGELLATNAAMRANPIGIIITLLVALGVGLVLAYKKSETFREIVNGAFHAVKVVIEDTRRIAGELWHGFEATLDWVRGHWHTIALLISGPFAPLVALATNAFGIRSAIVGALELVKSTAGAVIEDVVGFFAGLPKRLAKPIDAVIHDAILTPCRCHAFDRRQGFIDKVVDGVKWLIDHAKQIGDVFGSIGSKHRRRSPGS